MLGNKITCDTGVVLTIAPVSSSAIQQSQSGISDPEVPKFFIADSNRWVDNPHHPDYAVAQRNVAAQRAEAALRCVVRHGCKVTLPKNQSWLRQLIRWEDELLDSLDLQNQTDVIFLYIMREAIGSAEDIRLIVRNACLCSTDVETKMKEIGILRNGSDIAEVGLRHRLDTGIGYKVLAVGDMALVHPSEEYAACTHSGLSWWEWRNSGFDHEFMIESLALYRLDRLVDSHAKDAEASEIERKNRARAKK